MRPRAAISARSGVSPTSPLSRWRKWLAPWPGAGDSPSGACPSPGVSAPVLSCRRRAGVRSTRLVRSVAAPSSARGSPGRRARGLGGPWRRWPAASPMPPGGRFLAAMGLGRSRERSRHWRRRRLGDRRRRRVETWHVARLFGSSRWRSSPRVGLRANPERAPRLRRSSSKKTRRSRCLLASLPCRSSGSGRPSAAGTPRSSRFCVSTIPPGTGCSPSLRCSPPCTRRPSSGRSPSRWRRI